MAKIKLLDKKSEYTNKDYEHLGRLIHAIGETGYPNKHKLYKLAFIKGVFAGLGGVIGATIVVSLLLWIFSVVGEVPLLGQVADKVQNSIESSR
jgi:heme A synthase